LIPKLDLTSLIRMTWFILVSLLLGPFTLWFLLLGKKHRRSLEPAYFLRISLLCLGFLGWQAFLFLAPIHWIILLGVQLAASAITAILINREQNSRFFSFLKKRSSVGPTGPFSSLLLALGLAFYPVVYILALIQNIGDMDGFSIHLPSDVYTNGLQWMLYVTPLIMIAAFAAWKSGYKPSLRSLIYFYAALIVVLVWLMVWERLDLFLLNQVYASSLEPLFFSFLGEGRYRLTLKIIFYGGAFILGIGYLLGAARTSVFLKRAAFLGLPSLLLYANLLFALGDWNHYLAGFRIRMLDSQHFSVYRWVAQSQLLRTPNAYRTPAILEEWSEMEYQNGHIDKANLLLQNLIKSSANKTYHIRIRNRAERALTALQENTGIRTSFQLDLPVIKPAAYLDQDWYALLSAVGYLKPAWTDLDLKKKLLDLSISVQLRLPKLDNVPDLILALHQLEIPSATCFMTLDRIKTSLSAHHVPFISLYGHWVPISGFDAGRNGFYYYSHKESKGWDWLKSQETDLFYHQQGQAFGEKSNQPSQDKPGNGRVMQKDLLKFISSEELAEHILDIGGIGMILGDSTMIGPKERQAAFFVEQGDVYYQAHDNYQDAAEAYKKASELFPCDQVYSRMVYLKRRYSEFASDPGDYQNLFHNFPPEWMQNMGLDAQKEKTIAGLVLDGKLGSYLMMNWFVSPFLDSTKFTGQDIDTAIILYSKLHTQDPQEPLYTDSLASLMIRRNDLPAAEKLLLELTGLYPFGSQSAIYRLAWVKLRLGKIKEIPDLLKQCRGFSKEAKFLTLQAAVAMEKGHYRSAFSSLSKSLKLDKTLAESHSLLERYYRERGDKSLEKVHRTWQRRST
jgi:hypothetical protein